MKAEAAAGRKQAKPTSFEAHQRFHFRQREKCFAHK
jgi:hypothetical protein